MKQLIIIRGPSGSGKTSIANHFRACVRVGSSAWHEADHFFQTDAGYKFDASLLGEAHRNCQLEVKKRMEVEFDRVIVSNTSMTKRETKPYIKLAEKYGYDVNIVRTPGPWVLEDLYERNMHGVPLTILENQIKRYEPHTDEVEWKDISIFKS